jgi:uncharacterized damage-inducible protein DinB
VFPVEALRELFAHMEWADRTVWAALLAHPPAVSDRRLRDLMLHVHNVQRSFLHMWTNGPRVHPNPDEYPDLTTVHAWGRTVYPDIRAFVADVEPAALSRVIDMPWLAEFEAQTGRTFQRPTLAETMFQVTSHSTYHRGQANMRLRELGAEPPLVDYIAWIWFGRPEAGSWTDVSSS